MSVIILKWEREMMQQYGKMVTFGELGETYKGSLCIIIAIIP